MVGEPPLTFQTTNMDMSLMKVAPTDLLLQYSTTKGASIIIPAAISNSLQNSNVESLNMQVYTSSTNMMWPNMTASRTFYANAVGIALKVPGIGLPVNLSSTTTPLQISIPVQD